MRYAARTKTQFVDRHDKKRNRSKTKASARNQLGAERHRKPAEATDGGPAYRKYDLEAWMPGRNGYGEVASTSNTTDYQARRLAIRYCRNGGRPHLLHTPNGTAIAASRAFIPILKNYQQEDGSVLVPEALVPYGSKKNWSSPANALIQRPNSARRTIW